MRQSLAFLAALAIAAAGISAPVAAQNLSITGPQNRIPTSTHPATQQRRGAAQGGASGQETTRGVGCQRDSFGALICNDGSAQPAGAFGTRPVRTPAPGASPSPAATAQTRAPNPAAVIEPNVAEDGNLYGDPTMRSSTDGYGCRTDATGAFTCD